MFQVLSIMNFEGRDVTQPISIIYNVIYAHKVFPSIDG